MLALHGTGVSSGISIGKAYVLRRAQISVPEYNVPKALVEKEVERFQHAIDSSREQLELVHKHIPANAPAEAGSFIETHLLILADKLIAEAPIESIRKHKRNAEWALSIQGQELGRIFEQMDDPYLRNRRTDVDQVVERIMRNLVMPLDVGQEESVEAGQIIVANDLTPADTVLLKHNRIKAFVTDLGGPISHTAILARSLGIPAIVSIHSATQYIRNGEELIVDGKRGVLIISPDKSVQKEYRKRQREIARLKKEVESLRKAKSVTSDGRQIHLLANIELAADVKAAIRASAEGIGLYRTEFLYMNREQPPSEDEQFRTYRKVIKAMEGRPVTIRTFDLGADKQVDGGAGAGPVTINPALGLRAVRLCLSDPGLFRPQLRAILRAAVHGSVRMMIPMLSSQSELMRVLELIEDLKQELRAEGRPFDPDVPVGGMIEVPAAAIAADLFAPHLDFLSIGTNDLIQYTLAIDRVDDAVNYLYDPLHPSVLRLIATTINAGRAAGIPVAMCGEMAGDVRYTRLLVGLGLTQFSMHPATLLEIKKIIRESSAEELEELARAVMSTHDIRQLHELVDNANEVRSA
ncbi:MAG: phosphoenolpyruvate-protein phosphotransferase [Acidithiobacillales bacterium SG8_45]|nr:MAG: phosphoenolpyruvate-protein phosphotransferase [Acidithiobacillales bacterium SG8_45]